jgi:alpha-amylase
MLSVKSEAATQAVNVVRQCPIWDGKALTLDVSKTFPEGSMVRDFYSQKTAMVQNGKITLQPANGSGGLLLLERPKPPLQPLLAGKTRRSISC